MSHITRTVCSHLSYDGMVISSKYYFKIKSPKTHNMFWHFQNNMMCHKALSHFSLGNFEALQPLALQSSHTSQQYKPADTLSTLVKTA